MLHVHLSEAQRRELEAVSRQATGRVALRAHMVLLSDRGYSVPEIAAIHACGVDVVRTWLHRYARHGVAGLQDHPRSGRPPQDRLAGPIVDAQASQSPRCSGPVPACWSVALLRAFLARRFRLVLTRSSVRRYLHRMGWRWARPRWAPARKPDPEATAKAAALAQAARAATQGLAHLLYLALDGAPAHTAKVVERWLAAHPRLIVLRLPPYAAHQEHPVERIWGLMQDAVAADRLEGSITVLVVAARQFFTELAPHPVKLPLVA